MKKYVSIFTLFLTASVFADSTHLIRNCKVYDKPQKDAKLVCSLKTGNEVTVVGQDGEKIVQVSTKDCQGYIYSSCLASSIVSTESKAEASSKQPDEPLYKSRFKVGISLEGEGVSAKTTSSTVYSKGIGLGLGVLGEMQIIRGVYAQFIPTYRYQKISRELDGSGALKDPNPGSYSQTVWNISFELNGAVNIFELMGKPSRLPWIVRLGGEFLLPTSAKQVDPGGGETSFTADKMVNLVLGSGVLFPFTEKMGIRAGGDLFYHLTASNSTSLVGLRLGVVGILAL